MGKFIDYSELRAKMPPIDEIMRNRYGINLKRQGKELKGLCPFHNDHDPSMSVSPERGGVWYCPVCGEGGGVLEFVKRMERLPDCRTAAERLDADYLGGELAARAISEGDYLQREDERKVKTRALWERGAEIITGMIADRDFLGDDQSAGDLRGLLDSLDYNTSDPEETTETIRAIITAYGGNSAELDEISTSRSLKPSDFSDVAEGRLFASEYGDRVLFNPLFGWMTFDGTRWKTDEEKARALVQDLTDRQLAEANEAIISAAKNKVSNARGTAEEIDSAEKAVKKADEYFKFTLKRRDSKKISATMTEAKPSLSIGMEELDRHPLYLNTPRGTINLETGKMKPHDPRDLITTVTAFSPSEEGRETWENFVLQISDGDTELAEFLKVVCGMCSCGVVLDELLIIASGTGGNGKSTFWGAIKNALKDYGGTIKSDTLIAKDGQQKRFELADLRGKRLVISAETDEGQHLDGSMVKRICSTDTIRGEQKFKDSFDFVPSHHLTLFTNHLPVVDSADNGTWDRLLVLPFTAHFRNTEDEKKNFAEELTEKCGGAILQWCVEGAREYLKARRLPKLPQSVREVTEEYRANYDKLHAWITAKCETGRRCEGSSSELLESYNSFAKERGDGEMKREVFAKQVKSKGYTIAHTKTGNVVKGLKLKKQPETLVK